jgi:peroxiredoxin Q/BCP
MRTFRVAAALVVIFAACGGGPAASPPAATPTATSAVAAPATSATTSAPVATANPGPGAMSVGAPPLAEGQPAPDFEATAYDGTHVKLSAMRGKLVVVYFYPKDETPGCTKEACELRDAWNDLRAAGAVVIGVSLDDAASHKEFAEHHELPFLLVSDRDGSICRAFGVPVANGHSKRMTFLIDANGNIRRIWPTVNPVGHAAEILDAIRGRGA